MPTNFTVVPVRDGRRKTRKVGSVEEEEEEEEDVDDNNVLREADEYAPGRLAVEFDPLPLQ